MTRSRPTSPARALRPVPPLSDGAVVVTSREKRILAFMSETKKVGEWVPGRRNVVRAIMGTVHIDLREALLCQGEVEFDVTAIIGRGAVHRAPRSPRGMRGRGDPG